jgi:hypothetical protein
MLGYDGISYSKAVRLVLTWIDLLPQGGDERDTNFGHTCEAGLEGLDVAVGTRDANGIFPGGRFDAGGVGGSGGGHAWFAWILDRIRLDVTGELNSWFDLHDQTPRLQRADFKRLDIAGILNSYRLNVREL